MNKVENVKNELSITSSLENIFRDLVEIEKLSENIIVKINGNDQLDCEDMDKKVPETSISFLLGRIKIKTERIINRVSAINEFM